MKQDQSNKSEDKSHCYACKEFCQRSHCAYASDNIDDKKDETIE